VADLDELNVVAQLVESSEQAVDAVARIAIDPRDTPVTQPAQEEFANRGLPAPSATRNGERDADWRPARRVERARWLSWFRLTRVGGSLGCD
jgi:hypothetical protein